ncbi:outer membrane protein assembly factor BamB [Moraxella boevrei]|uniref:outer membrane protein assembly factor BamB n=1 Tax=Faucicola boevrei TaxID=346665 RepID=UPI0037350EA1
MMTHFLQTNAKNNLPPTAIKVLGMAILAVLVLNTTACQRFKKSESINPPTELVALSQTQNSLNPLFIQTEKLDKKFGFNKKQTLSQGETAFQTVSDAQGYITASPDGTVMAVDMNGHGVWQVEFKQGLHSGVAIDNRLATANIVIVADSNANLIALDRSNGKTLWQRQITSNVLAPALISGNRVVALANNGAVQGLSLQTGDVVWQFGTQNPSLSVRGSATPILLDSKTVLISTADGRIHGLNLDNGSPLWSRRVGTSVGASEIDRLVDVDATPIFVDNMLYLVTYSGQLLAVDMASRQIAFVKEIASLKSLSVDNSQLYVATLNGEVLALDKLTGNENWQSDSLKFRGISNPVATPNSVIVGDKLGYLHVFDKTTGTIIDRKQTKVDINHLTLHYIAQSPRLIAQSANGGFSVWQVVR